MDVRYVALAKAESPRLVRPTGSVTVDRPVQFMKAEPPMDVMADGSVSDVSLEQSLKAPAAIDVTDAGRFTAAERPGGQMTSEVRDLVASMPSTAANVALPAETENETRLEHPEKAVPSILVMVEGMARLARRVQLANAVFEMVVVPTGSSMSERLWQSLNMPTERTVNDPGKDALARLVQPAKTDVPTLVRLTGRSIAVSDEQSRKVWLPIVFRLAGRCTAASRVHPENAVVWRYAIPSGRVTDCRATQSRKASSPTAKEPDHVAGPVPRRTSRRAVHFWKAETPMVTPAAGTVTIVRPAQFQKEYDPMEPTPPGITTDVIVV